MAKTCPVSLKNHDVTARRKTHMACCGKYKALILKYVPYISKYMPYIFRFFRCLKHNNLQKPQNRPPKTRSRSIRIGA